MNSYRHLRILYIVSLVMNLVSLKSSFDCLRTMVSQVEAIPKPTIRKTYIDMSQLSPYRVDLPSNDPRYSSPVLSPVLAYEKEASNTYEKA
jgi:hypothetical protein